MNIKLSNNLNYTQITQQLNSDKDLYINIYKMLFGLKYDTKIEKANPDIFQSAKSEANKNNLINNCNPNVKKAIQLKQPKLIDFIGKQLIQDKNFYFFDLIQNAKFWTNWNNWKSNQNRHNTEYIITNAAKLNNANNAMNIMAQQLLENYPLFQTDIKDTDFWFCFNIYSTSNNTFDGEMCWLQQTIQEKFSYATKNYNNVKNIEDFIKQNHINITSSMIKKLFSYKEKVIQYGIDLLTQ